jgi:glyoxylase-like metal-dependent hydrolase (beta-lactamase superfamily II)
VATHRHYDHVGGLREFADRIGHADDADAIAHPDGEATLMTDGFPRAFIEFMEQGGRPLGATLIDALPHEGYDPASYAIAPAPLSRLIGEGDEVDTGDRVFTVLHLPGHTPGSIGLWDAKSGVLFSGDAIYDGPLFDFLPESDITSYVATMRKLRELPVEAVHGGHEPSMGRARMLEIIDEYVRAKGG